MKNSVLYYWCGDIFFSKMKKLEAMEKKTEIGIFLLY